MSDVGAWVGVGLENTMGTRVKSQVYLDAVSENLVADSTKQRSKAMTGGIFIKKVGVGAYNWQGPVICEVTPDKITKLFYAALGISSAGTVDPYTHTFKPAATSVRPISVQVFRPGPDAVPEPSYFSYLGGRVNYLEFSQDQESFLICEVGLEGNGNEQIDDAETSDVGIAYSTANAFIFHELAVTIGGVPSVITSDWKFRIATGNNRRRNLAAVRTMNRAFRGDSLVTGSFNLVFEDITEHRKFLASASDTADITPGTTLSEQALQLVWTQSATRKLTLKAGSAYYTASTPHIEARDRKIIQPVTWEAFYNASDASDVVMTVVNGETSANITTLGTDA